MNFDQADVGQDNEPNELMLLRVALENLRETAARAEGFTKTELGATMGGQPLYEACGYRGIELLQVPTPGGVRVPILRMGKTLS